MPPPAASSPGPAAARRVAVRRHGRAGGSVRACFEWINLLVADPGTRGYQAAVVNALEDRRMADAIEGNEPELFQPFLAELDWRSEPELLAWTPCCRGSRSALPSCAPRRSAW